MTNILLEVLKGSKNEWEKEKEDNTGKGEFSKERLSVDRIAN